MLTLQGDLKSVTLKQPKIHGRLCNISFSLNSSTEHETLNPLCDKIWRTHRSDQIKPKYGLDDQREGNQWTMVKAFQQEDTLLFPFSCPWGFSPFTIKLTLQGFQTRCWCIFLIQTSDTRLGRRTSCAKGWRGRIKDLDIESKHISYARVHWAQNCQ